MSHRKHSEKNDRTRREGEMNKIYFSEIKNPEEFPNVKTYYCPKWMQPFVKFIVTYIFKMRWIKLK